MIMKNVFKNSLFLFCFILLSCNSQNKINFTFINHSPNKIEDIILTTSYNNKDSIQIRSLDINKSLTREFNLNSKNKGEANFILQVNGDTLNSNFGYIENGKSSYKNIEIELKSDTAIIKQN